MLQSLTFLSTTTAAQGFDFQAASAVLCTGRSMQIGSYSTFQIPRPETQTQLTLRVNSNGGQIHVQIVVQPLGYDEANDTTGRGAISTQDFHFVKEVEYDSSEADPSITFNTAQHLETGMPTFLKVFRNGFFVAKSA